MGRGKGKRHFVPRPPRGGKTPRSTAAERFEYARKIWREDMEENGKITVSVNGANGMQMRMMEIFGCSARDAQLLKIRSEVVAEHREFEQRRRAETTTLTSRPLAKVLDLEPAPPEPEPEPTIPEPEPEPTLGRGRGGRHLRVRQDWVIQFMKKYPRAKNREIQEAVKARFGMTINHSWLAQAKRDFGVGNTRNAKPADPPKERTMPRPNNKPAEAVKSAVQLLLEECPDLEWLELKIVDGRPKVDFRVAVRRVEEGSVEL